MYRIEFLYLFLYMVLALHNKVHLLHCGADIHCFVYYIYTITVKGYEVVEMVAQTFNRVQVALWKGINSHSPTK